MWCKYRETCISSNKFRRPAIKFPPHWLELLSLCSYNFSFLIPCTVFNHFILNSHKNLVFSCDFASLPDASHGDQSSRSNRCWVSGFPCRSDAFVIKLYPFSTLQNQHKQVSLSCGYTARLYITDCTVQQENIEMRY